MGTLFGVHFVLIKINRLTKKNFQLKFCSPCDVHSAWGVTRDREDSSNNSAESQVQIGSSLDLLRGIYLVFTILIPRWWLYYYELWGRGYWPEKIVGLVPRSRRRSRLGTCPFAYWLYYDEVKRGAFREPGNVQSRLCQRVRRSGRSSVRAASSPLDLGTERSEAPSESPGNVQSLSDGGTEVRRLRSVKVRAASSPLDLGTERSEAPSESPGNVQSLSVGGTEVQNRFGEPGQHPDTPPKGFGLRGSHVSSVHTARIRAISSPSIGVVRGLLNPPLGMLVFGRRGSYILMRGEFHLARSGRDLVALSVLSVPSADRVREGGNRGPLCLGSGRLRSLRDVSSQPYWELLGIVFLVVLIFMFVKTSATVCHIKSLHVVQFHSTYVEYIARSHRVLPTRRSTICVALSP